MPDDDLREVLRRTRDLYDHQTSDYAEKTRSYSLFPGLVGEVERFMTLTLPRRRVVDLGCGVGRDTGYLLERGCSVAAVDLSHAMVEATGAYCGQHPRLRLVQAEMSRMPFRAASFDGAWVCASLLHVPSRHMPRTLAEIGRVLAPGAGVSISMKAGVGEGWHAGRTIGQDRWFTFVEPNEFASLMRTRGFVEVSVTPSGRYEWFVAEGRRPSRWSTRLDDSSAGSA